MEGRRKKRKYKTRGVKNAELAANIAATMYKEDKSSQTYKYVHEKCLMAHIKHILYMQH